MTENITYLSPNGQNISYGTGTVTRIYAATIKGVVTLDRQLRGKPWVESARTLEDLHIGALLFDPGSRKLFAGCHHDGGLWVSDNVGEGDWRKLDNGIKRSHIYSLASRIVNGRATIFAGTAPAALYRSDDLGEILGRSIGIARRPRFRRVDLYSAASSPTCQKRCLASDRSKYVFCLDRAGGIAENH